MNVYLKPAVFCSFVVGILTNDSYTRSFKPVSSWTNIVIHLLILPKLKKILKTQYIRQQIQVIQTIDYLSTESRQEKEAKEVQNSSVRSVKKIQG